MRSLPGKGNLAFKDYCLIMQVHPEADAAMIDAAYWHLARRYNQEARDDPSARAKLEELNEAYSVLGSAGRKEVYLKLRAAVLGEGALPIASAPRKEAPPLAVMGRQRPRPRDERAVPSRESPGWTFSAPAWRGAAAALILVALASAALLARVPAPVVAGLLVLGVPLIALALLRRAPPVPRLPLLRPRLPALRLPRRNPLARPSRIHDYVRPSDNPRIQHLRDSPPKDPSPEPTSARPAGS